MLQVTPPDAFKMFLIGESGSGKTSFLNYICNAVQIQASGIAKASKDIRPFNDMMLENVKAGAMESKTSGAKLYKTKICGLDVGVIDSPGFGDSRSLDQDRKHAEMIVSALTSETYINCICLVINGRTPRMSATLKYVLCEITSILPKVVLKNIIVVFTNSAEYLDINFDISVLRDFFGQPIPEDCIFWIENPYCLFSQGVEKLPYSVSESLQCSFNNAGAMLRKMHKSISKFEKVYTYHFGRLYERKQEIEKSLLRYMNLEVAIQRAKEEVDAAARSKKQNENYKVKQRYERWVMTPPHCHYTLCCTPGCHSNCHYPCHLLKSFSKEVFLTCDMMGQDGYCKKCGHIYSAHYHDEIKHEKEIEEVVFIDEAKKKCFQEAESMEKRKCVMLEREKLRTIELRKRLSIELKCNILEFQELGVTRSYVYLLKNQIAMIQERIEEEVCNVQDLIKVKSELEERLEIVQDALK